MISQKMQSLIWIFVMAVLLNYLWELAQAPLYLGLERYSAASFWHCFVASLGDGIMMLLIVAFGWIIFQRWDWFEHHSNRGYLEMLITGLLLALSVEWVGMHLLGRWQYTEKMPILPGLGIGIIPIAQMIFLSPLVFRTVLFLARKE